MLSQIKNILPQLFCAASWPHASRVRRQNTRLSSDRLNLSIRNCFTACARRSESRRSPLLFVKACPAGRPLGADMRQAEGQQECHDRDNERRIGEPGGEEPRSHGKTEARKCRLFPAASIKALRGTVTLTLAWYGRT